MKTIILLAALAAFVAADCPNACSGHGDCNSNWDYCMCYHGFIGADCSQRLCQFGLSWIDTPQGDLNHDNTLSGGFGDDTVTTASGGRPAGTPDTSALNPMWRFQGWWERHPAALYGTNDQAVDGLLPFYVRPQEGHFYAECSNRGVCNRGTGICDCLTGYEGAACNRTVCQSDCSGHGTCQTVREVTPSHLHYRLWDMDKTRICECDGGYFGIDCSQRNCMKNDDPLTVTATREDYNDGLTEIGEIQVVEVRCPFGGLMLDPSMSLTYTDVHFGDEYETARFDPSDTANGAAVVAALKALPNQVLADYVVDGVTLVSKVASATGAVYEANNHYAWTIEFDEHLGDVPLLSGTPYFKCQGGAEVSTLQTDGSYFIENIHVTFSGDGPASYMEIDGTFLADGTWTYSVFDMLGNNLAGDGVTDTYTVSGASAFAAGNAFTRELTKVTLDFGKANAESGRGALNIKIHVDPVVTARNQQYELIAGTADRNIGVTGDPTEFTLDTTETGVTADYDLHQVFDVVDTAGTGGTATAVARWTVNGEFRGFVDLDTTPTNLVAALTDGTTAPFDATFHTIAIDGVAMNSAQGYLGNVGITDAATGWTAGDHEGDYFEVFSYKRAHGGSTPFFYQAVEDGSDGNPIDVITLSYQDFQAPSLAIPIVIQITETSSDPDLYSWKVAGDTDWVVPVDGDGNPTGAAGFAMAATDAALGDVAWYLANRYPDDPMRAGLASVLIGFSGDADNDERICASQSANSRSGKYYIMVGTQGVNDAPVCSDRGICDYGSGICRCYKGYAGIDCSEQNALSAGYSGTTSAF